MRFEVVERDTEKELGFDPAGFSKGGNATCPFCGTVADIDYIKSEGCSHRIGRTMMAIVCARSDRSGKTYLSADDFQNFVPNDVLVKKRIYEVCQSSGLTVPQEPCVRTGGNQMAILHYGMHTYADIFTPRQMISLLTFSAAVRAAWKELQRRGYEPGVTAAVASALACVVDKQADFNSSLCVLKSGGGRGIVHTFGRQALPMVWDFAEANPFNDEIACWLGSLKEVVINLANLTIDGSANVVRGSATSLPWPTESFDAVITDPPYYDNVFYSNISDFFYVWLKRTIGSLYPEHFATNGTPKKNEAVADSIRHDGNSGEARRAYERMMAQAFSEANRVLKPGGQMLVVYAHKTTLGWSTLVDAIRQAGFTVMEAWPLDTETSGRLVAQNSASLASSIFLVARKRELALIGSYEDTVRPELTKIVRERVDSLWKMGISGADLVISAVGAGLRAFTRFSRIEYANGDEVPAERFLAEVEGVVLETLLEKIFGRVGAGVSAVDGPSRFYVLWRYAYKAAEMDAGEAIVFTYGQNVELDGQHGLSAGRHALVEKKKAKYLLRDFTERGEDERLGLPQENGTPAPLIDALHRTLWLLEHKPRKLNEFLDEARPNGERLRLIAQALAGAALSGNRDEAAEHAVSTTAAEQAALKKLVANWRTLIDQRLTGTLDMGKR